MLIHQFLEVYHVQLCMYKILTNKCNVYYFQTLGIRLVLYLCVTRNQFVHYSIHDKSVCVLPAHTRTIDVA